MVSDTFTFLYTINDISVPSSVVWMPKVTEGDEWGVDLIDDDISQIDCEGSVFEEKQGKEKQQETRGFKVHRLNLLQTCVLIWFSLYVSSIRPEKDVLRCQDVRAKCNEGNMTPAVFAVGIHHRCLRFQRQAFCFLFHDYWLGYIQLSH